LQVSSRRVVGVRLLNYMEILQVSSRRVIGVRFLNYMEITFKSLKLELLRAHMDHSSKYTKHHQQQIASTALILYLAVHSEV